MARQRPRASILALATTMRRQVRRHGRLPELLPWSLWGLWLILSSLTLWLSLRGPGSSDTLLGFIPVAYATVGALVASRHPSNSMGWLLLAVALAFTVQGLAEAYVSTPSNPGYPIVAWFAGWVWYVWLFLLTVYVPLLFPDGRLLSPRWRLVLPLAALGSVASIAGVAFKPGDVDLDVPRAIPNPLGATGIPAAVFKTAETVGGVVLIIAGLLAGASLVLRLRRSSGVERQQLTWFAFAGWLTLLGVTLAGGAFVLPNAWSDPVGSVGWTLFIAAALVGIPSATGIAIFRYHLYDIDLVINRTLVYGTLTAALLMTYVVSVLVLRPLLRPLAGDSDLAVALSTLAVAALFRPARARIQNTVDRRFYRHKYDAARTLDDFTDRLRHELDLDAVATDLCAAARDTMQPAHVSLWLRP